MAHTIYCLVCGSNCCMHVQVGRKTMLSPRELSVVRAVADPQYDGHKAIAYGLHLTEGTLKVYLCNIYQKLGWSGKGSARLLLLWAWANREGLEIATPTKDQFLTPTPPIAA